VSAEVDQSRTLQSSSPRHDALVGVPVTLGMTRLDSVVADWWSWPTHSVRRPKMGGSLSLRGVRGPLNSRPIACIVLHQVVSGQLGICHIRDTVDLASGWLPLTSASMRLLEPRRPITSPPRFTRSKWTTGRDATGWSMPGGTLREIDLARCEPLPRLSSRLPRRVPTSRPGVTTDTK
jgi:hypothetical protein